MIKIVVQPDGTWCYAEDFDYSIDDVLWLKVPEDLTEDEIEVVAYEVANDPTSHREYRV